MEEQNKGNNEEEWWECAWVKILILIVICVMPIIINRVTMFENSSHDYDTPSPWTEVWAEYGGALLSAGIALVILYKQQKQNQKINEDNRKQNHEENEANRKQNELQNQMNLNLQINALKYQQKYNWYVELKNALNDLAIACDINNLRHINIDIKSYYELTNKDEIDEVKSEIKESIDSYFFKIKSCNFSFLCLLNKEEKEELYESLKIINKDVYAYLNILNNLNYMINLIKHPQYNKMSKDKIKSRIDGYLESEKKEFEKLNEDQRVVVKIILKEYLEKYKYDFYGNTSNILNSIFNDFENKLESQIKITDKILQYERDKIDKLLDVDEIKKSLKANQNKMS